MFNLTSEEKQAVVFLMCVTLIGLGVYALAKKYSGVLRFVNVRNEIIKIDANKASFDELVATRVISEHLAGKIIEYRLTSGPFRAVDGLRNIKGVGQKRVEKLKDYLFVE